MRSIVLLFIIRRAPVHAGGTHWPVIVQEYEAVSESSAIITLRTEDSSERDELAGCKPLVVIAKYESEPFGSRTWSSMVSRQKHIEALQFIAQKHKSGEQFSFGYIGRGLVKAPGSSQCRRLSRGLLHQPNGVVLSFNERT